MKQRKNKNRKQNFDNYIITTTEYEQEYPVDVFPIKKQNNRIQSVKARTISEAVKKYSGQVVRLALLSAHYSQGKVEDGQMKIGISILNYIKFMLT